MSFIEGMKKRRDYLERKIKVLTKRVNKLPPGRLACYHTTNHLKWFVYGSTNKPGGKYIKKSERTYVEKLAARGLDESTIRDCQQELDMIDDFLARYENLTKPAGSNYYKNPDYKELVAPILEAGDLAIKKFLSQEYECADYPENRKYKCKNGLMVRSKSENLIADCLYARGIPFLYEFPYEVPEGYGKATIHPDFTILDCNTMTIRIWEHFGLMSDEHYQHTASKKIRQLASIGYYPDENLIMTFESPNHMLSSAEIEDKINNFFQDTL